MEPFPNSGSTTSYRTLIICCVQYSINILVLVLKTCFSVSFFYLNSQENAAARLTCPVDRSILIRSRVSVLRFVDSNVFDVG